MQVQKSSITVGSRAAGDAWVDGGSVRGEGGLLHPQLVVPLSISMNPQPADAQVVIASIRAGLSLVDPPQAQNFLCPPVTESLIEGFSVRSLESPRDMSVELRFFMTHQEVAAIEAKRQRHASDPLLVHLHVNAIAAAISTYNQVHSSQASEKTPWDLQFGMLSHVLPFWTTRVYPVRFAIEQSRWVDEVLPGLGHNRQRLIELAFPPPLPNHPGAAAEWDKARRAFDERRYGDCVAECRDLLSMWSKELGANKANTVATLVGDRAGWAPDDRRRMFLDGLWKSAVDIVNVPHHPEGQNGHQDFASPEARLVLLLTASLCEFLGAK